MHSFLILSIFNAAAQAWNTPCAEVSSSWAAQATAAFTRTRRAQVPAQLAFECLMSVPVDIEGDIKQIEEPKHFLEFQSTLNCLNTGHYINIESAIHNKPLNLLAELDYTAQSIKDRAYHSDFEVQLALHSLFRRAKDSHLRIFPDMLEVFLFVRPETKLVSISEDGLDLPRLYLLSDLHLASASGNFVPSCVETINGKNATEYLQSLWTHGTYHDEDAQYNSFFPNPAAEVVGMDSGGQFHLTQGLYDGPVTTFGFMNGSRVVNENIAMIREFYNFSNINDGSSFFAKFCQGDTNEVEANSPTQTSAESIEPIFLRSDTYMLPEEYPEPVITQSGLSVQGYQLESRRHYDVAVLALPNFKPIAEPRQDTDETVAGFLEAQAVLQDFIMQSKQKGLKKLIIDLRGNSGGTIDMAFEFFKQLFPSVEPFGASRFRAHDAFYMYSKSVADLIESDTAMVMNDGLFSEVARSTANFQNLLNIEGMPFANFTTYYGPYREDGDAFTAIRRYNFSNHLGGHTLAPYVNITGYNFALLASPTQPFLPENMVILHDGICQSACAIFSQLMREQGHVQTIAIGGRPRKEPMQGVGGTKGAQLLTFDSIIKHMQTTLRITSVLHGKDGERRLLQTTPVGSLLNASQIRLRSARFSGDGHANGAVNSLDNMGRVDDKLVPLEFVYEAADCRLFYTAKSYINPTRLWEMAADAKWGDSSCVEGSMSHATAIGSMRGEPFNTSENLKFIGFFRFSITCMIVFTFIVGAFHSLRKSPSVPEDDCKGYHQINSADLDF
ncbi:hypothetical protein PFICI_13922 [Pestalotiopsis fici W106-1]|uniref:Uncharacterized protein n=1 Tax=Pestalotiopsis fici (strain W106-1 / CGMCC3.15140) TaxID=1229662 RepID=W3WMK7_PESFW|nr:uncharacterized protein PFICI_13922 [Pestalotiopsis fici W106-1]ETS74056.1 hypothetical protein PFICI_13922 [Pestalotiopsis fici W106-1]